MKIHCFYDFIFNCVPYNMSYGILIASVVKYSYLQEFIQHIKGLSSKAVNLQ